VLSPFCCFNNLHISGLLRSKIVGLFDFVDQCLYLYPLVVGGARVAQ
jgi:hypothetical protein